MSPRSQVSRRGRVMSCTRSGPEGGRPPGMEPLSLGSELRGVADCMLLSWSRRAVWRWCPLLDLIEDLADGGVGHIGNVAQPSTAVRVERDVEIEDPLQWYLARRWAQVSRAMGRSLSSSGPAVGGLGLSSRHDGVFSLPLRCIWYHGVAKR